MSNANDLDQRLRAVERTLTDSDDDLTDLRDAAELTREVEALSERLDEVETRLDELDAAMQALRGYVGSVRAVNESVERRADAALAKVEELETEAFEADRGSPDSVTTDGRATGSDGIDTDAITPCDCRSRRSETPSVVDERDTTPENNRGLLARIVEVL